VNFALATTAGTLYLIASILEPWATSTEQTSPAAAMLTSILLAILSTFALAANIARKFTRETS
jgi:hypothetical protein